MGVKKASSSSSSSLPLPAAFLLVSSPIWAEEVEAALERDTYMTAEEAVAFGIVDRAAVSATDLDERKGGEKKRE